MKVRVTDSVDKKLVVTFTDEERTMFLESHGEFGQAQPGIFDRIKQLHEAVCEWFTPEHTYVEAESESAALFSDYKIAAQIKGEVIHMKDPDQGELFDAKEKPNDGDTTH